MGSEHIQVDSYSAGQVVSSTHSSPSFEDLFLLFSYRPLYAFLIQALPFPSLNTLSAAVTQKPRPATMPNTRPTSAAQADHHHAPDHPWPHPQASLCPVPTSSKDP